MWPFKNYELPCFLQTTTPPFNCILFWQRKSTLFQRNRVLGLLCEADFPKTDATTTDGGDWWTCKSIKSFAAIYLLPRGQAIENSWGYCCSGTRLRGVEQSTGSAFAGQMSRAKMGINGLSSIRLIPIQIIILPHYDSSTTTTSNSNNNNNIQSSRKRACLRRRWVANWRRLVFNHNELLSCALLLVQ